MLISFEIDSETDDLISLDKDAEIGIITEIKGHYLVEFTYEKQRCRGYVKTERLSQQLAFMQIVVPLNIGDQIDNLGINQTGSNVNVYTGPSTSYSVKGYIVGNEIVYVYAEELGWYYIKYKTSTTDKAGYIFADNVSIPSTDYVRSIRDGVRTWDYNGSTHVGVDIDTGSLSNQTQNLYAIDQGDAKYYTRTKYISGLGWCTVSYVTMSS